ncbi:MAG: hypothetical protein HOC72_00945 [Rhodospirillaceae bacterium]|nr:hypothetical protein [Rhodospirillaceae bacterium]
MAASAAEITFSSAQRATILSHGPWPPRIVVDPSNRVSGNGAAIALGKRLFSDPRLSSTGTVSCAGCHDEAKDFTDGRRLAHGLMPLARNTPTVWNVRFNRWFGWAGAVDTLWGASVRPILAADEMAATGAHAVALLLGDGELTNLFVSAFGRQPGATFSNETGGDDTLVAVGKALAAYQETLVTRRTPFDDFRDALARDSDNGDGAAMKRYPAAALRGLKIFVGQGRCSVCHLGPLFTNGEFDDAGISYFTGPGKVDKGRYGGIGLFRLSPFTRHGKYSDRPDDAMARLTQGVALRHRDWGAFRVPSLRNVALTGPYMHNGSLATLRDVVRHYSEIDVERLHTDGSAILRPLHLSPEEIDDLLAFLASLSDRTSR